MLGWSVMPDWLPAKVADTLIPEVIDRLRSRRVLHAVFWPSLALVAAPITVQNGLAAVFFVLATALIVWRTSRVGLAGVHFAVWVPGAAFMLLIALILGGFQARLDKGVNLPGHAGRRGGAGGSEGGQVMVETDPLEITVGLLAGYQWFRAAFQPWWR